jgi:hypothetical protein
VNTVYSFQTKQPITKEMLARVELASGVPYYDVSRILSSMGWQELRNIQHHVTWVNEAGNRKIVLPNYGRSVAAPLVDRVIAAILETDEPVPQNDYDLKKPLDVSATRSGQWWIVDIPQIGAHTQAPQYRTVPPAALFAAMSMLNVDSTAIELNVTYSVPESALTDWERSQKLFANGEESEGLRLAKQAVRTLREAELTVRDCALRLGLTMGQVRRYT